MKNLFIITSLCALLASPVMAQDQGNEEDNAAEATEAEAEAPTAEEIDAAVKAINSVAGDKKKAEGYCAIAKEMDGVKEGDEKKAEELDKKMDTYLTGLGEDVVDAFDIADAVDPETEQGQKIDAAFGALSEKCPG